MSSAIISPSDIFSFQPDVDDDIGFNAFAKHSKKKVTPIKKKITPIKKKITPTKRKQVVKVTKKKPTPKKNKASSKLTAVSDDEDKDVEIINDQKDEKLNNSSKVKSQKGEKSVEQIYQKKSQLEHILLRPDTYIGSVERVKEQMFILDSSTKRIVKKEITYTPGLFKIFDEIIVNAADNKQRDPNMNLLVVDIDGPKNTISIKNNGKGIPIVKHKEHKCYVPTLIFGHLLTGSNFDDDEKKTTGGRNGYGAKLANIFSKKFIVECVDISTGLKLKQIFRNNMNIADDPIIKAATKTQIKAGDYVKISFQPDLKRFQMDALDEDIIGLFSKRAYDVAGTMANRNGKRLVVVLNGEKLPIKKFDSYLKLYDGILPPVAYEKINDRWEVGVGPSDGSFQQISFVNEICTSKGGGHTEHIANQVAASLTQVMKKKFKSESKIKKNQIMNHFCVFVNCLVENPTFDSQTKEFLTTRPKSFGTTCTLSPTFLKKIEKSEIVQNILAYSKFKENQALKKTGGKKKTKLTGIDKLDDANFAGSAKSKDCTLIITEGDSAKSLAMSGISVVGRDYYGAFPLKGKLLNVREATHAQIMKNGEIKQIIDIIGLKFGVKYNQDNIKTLRYGHLMIMTDQDHDGSHIKGLVINFIHHFWPSLLDVPGFLLQFVTPIVKATKGKKTFTFFTLPEYQKWREKMEESIRNGYTIKYYKGLGTSTSSEAKEYFGDLEKHEIEFSTLSDDVKPTIKNAVENSEKSDDELVPDKMISGGDLIEMAFKKNRVDDRKTWLNNLEKGTYLNYSKAKNKGVCYSDFINKELVLFSQADNQRSIPHIYDGFKPSQRKILFSCFKRKLKKEIKVAQLAGYVSEHSAYHHGEMSLTGTIVNMAQSFCGSNNINLLTPSGQFGTRRMGGKDAASPRYIFTKLEKITRAIFHPDDDALLQYLSDDGLSIEPEFYMPVIPMILVNGADGIGTGWSSFVPNYSPRQIIRNLKHLINNEDMEEMSPFYSGYNGDIIPEIGLREGNFIVRGEIDRVDDTTLHISELPVKVWTHNYKAFLESLIVTSDKVEPDIKDFKEDHTDTTVSFTVIASKEKIDLFESGKDGLYGKFKLLGKLHTSNMNLFDELGRIIKYQNPHDIMTSFYSARIDFYGRRKNLLLSIMERDLNILNNKARFVEEVCKNDLIINNRKRKDILRELHERGYDLFDKNEKAESESEEFVETNAADAELARGYDYLIGMKIWNLTAEYVSKLKEKVKDKQQDVIELEATPLRKLWENDLDAIEDLLDERDQEFALAAEDEQNAKKRRPMKKLKKQKNKIFKKKKKDESASFSDDESEFSDYKVESDSDEKPRKASKKSIVPKQKIVKGKQPSNNVSKETVPSPTSSDVKVLSKTTNSKSTVTPTLTKRNKRLSTTKISIDDNMTSDVEVESNKRSASKWQSKAEPQSKKQMTQKDEDYTEEAEEENSISNSGASVSRNPMRHSSRKRKIKQSYALDLEDSDALVNSSEEDSIS